MAEKDRVVPVSIRLKGKGKPRPTILRRANSTLKANTTVKANASRVVVRS